MLLFSYPYISVLYVSATDLYTFDLDAASAEATFDEVCDSYVRIFTRLGLPFVQGVVMCCVKISFLDIVIVVVCSI